MQALIYARLLAGKLNEAWEVLAKAWFATKLSLKLEPKLHPQAKEARVQLGAYFGRTNLINRVRNSVAFHYSAEAVGAAWEEVADEFETILGGTVGNNLHHGSELAANAALMKAVNPTDLEEALATFLNEVQSIASYFTEFFDGVLLVMLEDVLGPDFRNAGTYAEILPPHFRDVHVPFFCIPDLSADTSNGGDVEA
jgi:hypothetical protein